MSVSTKSERLMPALRARLAQLPFQRMPGRHALTTVKNANASEALMAPMLRQGQAGVNRGERGEKENAQPSGEPEGWA
ncbi:MAG: hypothetical protein Q4D19_06990 [Lautropia sp.]|nr:hypothetical protein [Lautropia sp.]